MFLEYFICPAFGLDLNGYPLSSFLEVFAINRFQYYFKTTFIRITEINNTRNDIVEEIDILKGSQMKESIGFPGIDIGEEITNTELTTIFKISLRSGMNRSKRTNSLVLISNHTRDYYDDVWKNDVLHYTGMGLTGDQKLTFKQNKTLNASNTNGVKVYLFEVFTKGRYRYYGQVTLVESPYPAKQLDYKKRTRSVWIFPLRRVSIENAGDKVVPIDSAISEEDFLKEQQLKEKQARQLTDNELRNKLEGIVKEPVIQQVLSNRYERNAIIGELARRKAKG